jgi:hypothetical protein
MIGPDPRSEGASGGPSGRSGADRGAGAPKGAALIHPGTGEVLTDVATVSTEVLAEAALLLREHEREMRDMRHAMETELGERYEQRRRRGGADHPTGWWPVGDYEVKPKWSAEWDADELDGVVRDLIDRGVVEPRAAAGVFKRTITVSRSVAARFLNHLEGTPAYAEVKQCRTWRRAGLEVVRSVPLLPPPD